MLVFLQRRTIIQFFGYFYHRYLLDIYLQPQRCQKYKVLVAKLLSFYREKQEKEGRYGSCFLHEFLK